MSSPLYWVYLYVLPLLTTLTLWGILTIALLWLNRCRRSLVRVVVLVATVVLLLAHQQLQIARTDLSIVGNYRAFIASMLIWAWHELAFYSGVLAGPWKKPCPPTAHGMHRLRYALLTHAYHLVAVGSEMLVLLMLHYAAPNRVGVWVFVFLWLMQLNAKLNVFLGVPNLQVAMLPTTMRYLGTFWRNTPGNRYFMPSVLCIAAMALFCWWQTLFVPLAAGGVGYSFLAALTTLGVIEHTLLVLPLSKKHEQTEKNQPNSVVGK